MALVEVDKAENLQWVEFDKVTNVPLGTMKMVKIKDIPITVANVDGKFYAFNDRCPHTNAALHKGFLRGKVVICPLHYASFDVTTGKKLGILCLNSLERWLRNSRLHSSRCLRKKEGK